MLREIEKELVCYFNVKIKKLYNDYELPDIDEIHTCTSKFSFQAMRHTRYERIENDFVEYYNSIPVNFISISVEGVYSASRPEDQFRLIFINFYIYLDQEAKKIERIESSCGILKDKPSFHELINYLKYCIGMKRNDFKDLLDKLRLANIAAV